MQRSARRLLGGTFFLFVAALSCSRRDGSEDQTAIIKEDLTAAELSRILSFEGTIGSGGDWYLAVVR
jgi:hypothetical protein